MQTVSDLTANFTLDDLLTFDEPVAGMPRVRITTPACTAELYLHGAHLALWQPTGHGPALYLSPRSEFAPTKAIRGGVPVIFPWFGPRTATPTSPRTDGPAHGFARTTTWDLAFAALAGDDLHLTLTLGPDDNSRALGFDQFRLAYTLILGRELTLRLTVANEADAPLHFEEALHTYLHVGDVEQTTITGLANTDYLDKTDNFARKHQAEETLTLTQTTDRPYLNTASAINIDDPTLHRRLTVSKTNSQTTVIWNPWSTGSATIKDLPPEGWHNFLCCEAANAGENAITLPARQAHTMEQHIKVSTL